MNFKNFTLDYCGVVIIGYSYVKGINNNAVGYEQGINEAWGNVQTSYQEMT
jgi:LemA protein